MQLFELDELAQIIDPKAWENHNYQLSRAHEYDELDKNFRNNHPDEKSGWSYRRIEWEIIAANTIADSRKTAKRVIEAIEEKLNDRNKT